MTSLSFELEPRKSALDGCSMIEQFPRERLVSLLKYGSLPDAWVGDDEWVKYMRSIYPKGAKQMMQDYLAAYDRSIGGVRVGYAKSPRNPWGRVFPHKSLGLSCIPREFRNYLIRDVYFDFDLKNCHPAIMHALCQKEGLECPSIARYVEHRDEVLAFVSDFYKVQKTKDRDPAKELFLRLCYGGTFDAWCAENRLVGAPIDRFILDFIADLELFTDRAIKGAPKLWERMKKQFAPDKAKERRRGFLGLYNQELELRIVEQVMFAIKSETNLYGLGDSMFGTYEYDGTKIGRDAVLEYGSPADVVQLLNETTLSVTGLPLEWSQKEIGCSLDFPVDDDETDEDSVSVVSSASVAVDEDKITDDKMAALKFIRLHRHVVNCKGTVYVYDSQTGMWGGSLLKVITDYAEDLYLYKRTKDGLTKTDISYGSNMNYIQKLLRIVPELCVDNKWEEKTCDSSLGKLLFSNGILDMKAGKFHTGFDPAVVFFARFDYPFEAFSEEDTNYMWDIQDRLFFSPLGEAMGTYLLTYFARALAGDCQKRIMFGLGTSNAGKSMISRAVLNACSGYAASFSGECLAYTRSTADEAAKNRWLLLLRYKRILLSNEINMDVCLNANSIKKLCSGRDDIVGRSHGKEEIEFKPHFMAVLFANDIPEIKPVDKGLANRLCAVNFTKEYVMNPTSKNHLQMDPALPSEIASPRFARAMLALLIHTYATADLDYVPPEAAQDRETWFPEVEQVSKNSLPDEFFSEFTISGKEEDFIPSRDIQSWMTSRGLKTSMTKMAVDMKAYAAEHGLTIHSKSKKVGGKVIQCWFGIKSAWSPETEDSEIILN